MIEETKVVQEKNSPGRPEKPIYWPEGSFTVESVSKSQGLHRLTVSKRIKKALLNQELLRAGQQRGKGKPAVLYSKA